VRCAEKRLFRRTSVFGSVREGKEGEQREVREEREREGEVPVVRELSKVSSEL
jgi:hypothetical protein